MNYDEAIKVLKRNCVSEQWLKENATDEDANGCDEAREYNEVVNFFEKEHELLDLYRLLIEFKERYNTAVRLLDKQDVLDNIREITDEIYELERELK